MATILDSFDIDSPQFGKAFKIELADGLDQAHLDFMEAKWAPALKRQYDLAILQYFQLPTAAQTDQAFSDILQRLEVEDQHWTWSTKGVVAPGAQTRVFSLLNAGEVEAAMVLQLDRNSWDPAAPLPIVYVDFVAVAPWNRKTFQDPQRFRRLGTLMLGAAVELSRMLGRDGRCGLHALGQSEGFYRHIGMRDFGLDAAYSSLRYFEFDAPAARNFRK